MSGPRAVAYNRGAMLDSIILVTAAGLVLAGLLAQLRTFHAGTEAGIELRYLLEHQLGDMTEDVPQRHRGRQHREKWQASRDNQSSYLSQRHRYELHLIHVGGDGVEIGGGGKIW